jgi:hypothetical protein
VPADRATSRITKASPEKSKKAPGEGGDALEEEGQGGHADDGGARQDGVVREVDQGLERPLSAHDVHGHGAQHEADGHGGEQADVPEELAEKVLGI